MDKSTHEIRCKQWTQIINNCLASGQSKKQWCRDNGISEKSFYYWQRKLRTRIAESASPQLVPLEPPAPPEEQLYIQYRGAELKLPDRVDMDAVAAILRSLQSL